MNKGGAGLENWTIFMDVICVSSLGLIQNEFKIYFCIIVEGYNRVSINRLINIFYIAASISYLFQTYSCCKFYPITKLYDYIVTSSLKLLLYLLTQQQTFIYLYRLKFTDSIEVMWP